MFSPQTDEFMEEHFSCPYTWSVFLLSGVRFWGFFGVTVGIFCLDFRFFFCSQLKEYQQKNSPGATAGTKKKRKTKEGSRPATPTTDDQQPPENVSVSFFLPNHLPPPSSLVFWTIWLELGSGCAGIRAEWCRCCMKCATVVGSCLFGKVQLASEPVWWCPRCAQSCWAEVCGPHELDEAGSLAALDWRFLSVLLWAVSLSPLLSPPVDSEHSEGAGVRP